MCLPELKSPLTLYVNQQFTGYALVTQTVYR